MTPKKREAPRCPVCRKPMKMLYRRVPSGKKRDWVPTGIHECPECHEVHGVPKPLSKKKKTGHGDMCVDLRLDIVGDIGPSVLDGKKCIPSSTTEAKLLIDDGFFVQCRGGRTRIEMGRAGPVLELSMSLEAAENLREALSGLKRYAYLTQEEMNKREIEESQAWIKEISQDK